ncbi:MAG: TlpA family protein disulfide reductase [Nitrospirae bacterium]|nr:MAG: TlpA family protein disulfide reductase [Nitrospirota bacterium]
MDREKGATMIGKKAAILIFCLFGFGVGGWADRSQGMGVRPPVVGSPAPDFELRDLEGKVHRLSDYRGNVVLLNFWATWCEPCRKEMPAMQAAYERLKDRGFVVLAINELEDVEQVREHIQKYGHTFEVLLDPDNRVANQYGVVGLPVSVFVDQEGRIQAYIRGGLLTVDLIERHVQTMLAKQKMAPSHQNPS